MATLQMLLGIELPIIQAPMAGVQDSRLAVAVSNAGGLGSLPCAMLGPDAVRRELAYIAAQHHTAIQRQLLLPPPPGAEPATRGRVASRARPVLSRARA